MKALYMCIGKTESCSKAIAHHHWLPYVLPRIIDLCDMAIDDASAARGRTVAAILYVLHTCAKHLTCELLGVC